MIYLKMVTTKMNKYIEDKSERKYKKLEDSVRVLKNITSSSVSKNTRTY